MTIQAEAKGCETCGGYRWVSDEGYFHGQPREVACPRCNGSGSEPDAGLTLGEALAIVAKVDAHLDSNVSPQYQDQPLARRWARVTKVCEEAGEVWRALSNATGENYRKGVSGTEDELLGELGDTVSAAMCAIQHLTKDEDRTWDVVSAALAKAGRRVDRLTGEAAGQLRLPGVA